MKWIKATERLPEVLPDTSETFFVRMLDDNKKKVSYYGISGSSLLRRYPLNIEWLDESEPPTTADASVLVEALERCIGVIDMECDDNGLVDELRAIVRNYSNQPLPNKIEEPGLKEGELCKELAKQLIEVWSTEGGIESVKRIGGSISIRMKTGSAYWCKFEKQAKVTLD